MAEDGTGARTLTGDGDARSQAEPPRSAPDAPIADPRTGQIVGHFRLGDVLGRGGMGVVFVAEDLRLGRRVALKLLPEEVVAQRERRARFLREARAAAAVVHPNVATIFEVGEHGDAVFLAMELVQGPSLRAHLEARPQPMPVTRALDLALQIAEGLAAAHATGVVHRDLKPENIVLTQAESSVKVLDFGLAKMAAAPDDARSDAATALATEEGRILGTAGYMAPEQARGEDVGAPADVFAIGVILYEMLAGKRPFSGPSRLAVLIATDRDAPAPLADLRPDVPASLACIVEKCLQKKADQRFAHAGQLRDALRDLRDLPPHDARSGPKSPADPAPAPPPRSSLRGVAIVLGALIAAGAAFALWPRSPAAPPPLPSSSVATSAATSTISLGSQAIVASASAPAPSASGPTSASVGEVRWPSYMRCAPESKEAGSCLKDLVPWCDATGARRVCCGRGLVPRDEAGLCGCAPGGTRAPEAIERGCSAPPDDADATYKKEHLAMFDRVVACFSPKITAKSIRGGKMGFQYALGPDGRVIASRLDQSDVPDEEAQRCALDRIQASRFTAPPEDRVGALRGFGFQLQD